MGKISNGLRRFMEGRYGTDKLNICILVVALAVSIVGRFVKAPVAGLILMAVSFALMFWAIFRMLSRNTYRRYQENRRFLSLLDRIKDREHKYFQCPKCRQPVRVPRGKGKISITCPRCKEKFVRKS